MTSIKCGKNVLLKILIQELFLFFLVGSEPVYGQCQVWRKKCYFKIQTQKSFTGSFLFVDNETTCLLPVSSVDNTTFKMAKVIKEGS